MGIRYFDHNHKRIAYTDQGVGQTIYLIHGFCEDQRIWKELVFDLSKSYRVLTIDLFGFGKSSVLHNLDIKDYSQQVVFLLDILDITNCIFIGHSLGGYIALDIADRYTERVRGLGIFHSHPYADSEFKKKTRLKSVDFIKNNGVLVYVKQVLTSLFVPTFAEQNPQIVTKLIERASEYSPDGIIAAQHAMINRQDTSYVLRDLDVPVLFILGVQDPLILEKDNLKQTILPKVSSVHYIQSAGHMGMFEAPRICLHALKDYMEFVKTK